MSTIEDLWQKCWDEEVANRGDQSPSFDPKDYALTGRASAKYGGKKGPDWWADNGPEMIQRWLDWRAENPWDVWVTPDGKPAIEIELNVILPGDIPVRMFIDRIYVMPSGQLCVLDLKSGRLPDFDEQLGLYATGVELAYGKQFRPEWGYFWDASKGTHGSPRPLEGWTPTLMSAIYKEAAAGINAGSFLPKPANGCAAWCGAAPYCFIVGGSKAKGVDPLADA